jgi:hypothetical protein
MQKDDVAFVSGFLRAFAMANAGVNYGPDYWLENVPRHGSAIESVVAYHEHTRRHYEKIYPKYDLMPKLEPAQGWSTELPVLLRRWLFEGEFSPRLGLDGIDGPTWIVEYLVEKLKQSLEGEVSVFKATIFFSENEADDWLFEDSVGLYHLHLGWSD